MTLDEFFDGTEELRFLRKNLQVNMEVFATAMSKENRDSLMRTNLIAIRQYIQELKKPTPTLDQLEAKYIQRAIKKAKGNLTDAAMSLGIGRATLYRKIKQYDLEVK